MTDKVAIKVYFPNETYKSIVVVKDMQCKDIKSKLSRGLQGGKSNESDDDSRDYQLLEVNGEGIVMMVMVDCVSSCSRSVI